MISHIVDHIDVDSSVCGGRPHIAGHRIRVQDIVTWHESQGCSPDEIIARFPQLTLADVYAALAYYHDHRDEIQQDMARDDALAKQVMAAISSKIERRSMNCDAPN